MDLSFYGANGVHLQTITVTTGTTSRDDLNLTNVSGFSLKNNHSLSDRFVYEIDLYGDVKDDDGIPPPTPTGLTGVDTEGGISLNWSPSVADDLDGYNVYSNGQKANATPIKTTFYDLTGLAGDTLYQIGVKAVDLHGNESNLSNTVTYIRDGTPPTKPKGLMFTALSQGQSIMLEWILNPAVDGVTTYRIYRDGAALMDRAQTRATITAAPNVSHSYTVTAIDAAGNESEPSDPVTGAALVVPDTTPPAAPSGLVATGLEGKVRLVWQANTEPDIAGYIIYRNGVKLNTEPHSGTTYEVVGGMDWGTQYRFHVAAVDHSGNVSPKSNEARAVPIAPADTTPPDKPLNLTASMSGDYLSILLSWAAANESDIAGYYVYFSPDNLSYSKLNAAPIDAISFTYDEIEGNKRYYFKLSAVDQSGNESQPTKEIMIKTPIRDPNEDTDKDKLRLLVSWQSISGAMEYLIYYNGNLIAVVPPDVTSFEITEEHGYTGQPPNVVDVKARFIDGSIGTDTNMQNDKRWGLSVADIWQSTAGVIGTLSGFLLLGIVIMLAPRMIKVIKQAVARRAMR